MPLHRHYKKPRKVTFRKVYGRPWNPKPGEIKSSKGLPARSSDTVHLIAGGKLSFCNRNVFDVRDLNLSTLKRGMFWTKNIIYCTCLLCEEAAIR